MPAFPRRHRMIDTQKKTWLITGVSSGLGRSLAEVVLRRGDRVVGTVRSEQAKADFEKIEKGQSVGLILDITHEENVRDAVASVERRFGAIHVLVNNAG